MENLRDKVRYDPNTGHLYAKYKYARCVVLGKPLGCTKRYVEVVVDRKKYYAHRLCWFLYYGDWPIGQIDHINGNKTDNRIENLRDVSPSDQSKNKPRFKNNTSGLSGVSYDKSRKKWRAYGSVNNQYIYIGRYSSYKDAVEARKNFNKRNGYSKRHGK